MLRTISMLYSESNVAGTGTSQQIAATQPNVRNAEMLMKPKTVTRKTLCVATAFNQKKNQIWCGIQLLTKKTVSPLSRLAVVEYFIIQKTGYDRHGTNRDPGCSFW